MTSRFYFFSVFCNVVMSFKLLVLTKKIKYYLCLSELIGHIKTSKMFNDSHHFLIFQIWRTFFFQTFNCWCNFFIQYLYLDRKDMKLYIFFIKFKETHNCHNSNFFFLFLNFLVVPKKYLTTSFKKKTANFFNSRFI